MKFCVIANIIDLVSVLVRRIDIRLLITSSLIDDSMWKRTAGIHEYKHRDIYYNQSLLSFGSKLNTVNES